MLNILNLYQKVGILPNNIFLLIGLVYNIFILIAIYRSAVKYKGNKIWSILVSYFSDYKYYIYNKYISCNISSNN